MDRLHVATLNIRNLADRWDERLPLLLADMAALQPDLLGLQEVVYVLQQDRLIGSAGAGRYESSRGWAVRPEYGPAKDVDGPPGCLDYIWVKGAIAVEACDLVFDRPAVADSGLYPSDHLGLAARLLIG